MRTCYIFVILTLSFGSEVSCFLFPRLVRIQPKPQSVLRYYEDDSDRTPPPPPPSGGQGEWADWDNDNYSIDDVVDGDEDFAAKPTLLGSSIFFGDLTSLQNKTSSLSNIKSDHDNDDDIYDDEEENSRLYTQALRKAFQPQFQQTVAPTAVKPPPKIPLGLFNEDEDTAETLSLRNAIRATSIIDSVVNIPKKPDVYVRNEKDWEGWSEEPPFFDEIEIEEAPERTFEKNTRYTSNPWEKYVPTLPGAPLEPDVPTIELEAMPLDVAKSTFTSGATNVASIAVAAVAAATSDPLPVKSYPSSITAGSETPLHASLALIVDKLINLVAVLVGCNILLSVIVVLSSLSASR